MSEFIQKEDANELAKATIGKGREVTSAVCLKIPDDLMGEMWLDHHRSPATSPLPAEIRSFVLWRGTVSWSGSNRQPWGWKYHEENGDPVNAYWMPISISPPCSPWTLAAGSYALRNLTSWEGRLHSTVGRGPSEPAIKTTLQWRPPRSTQLSIIVFMLHSEIWVGIWHLRDILMWKTQSKIMQTLSCKHWKHFLRFY